MLNLFQKIDYMKENLYYYLNFCKLFKKIRMFQLKFKDLNNHYKVIYKEKYSIGENSINKATFSILFTSFILIGSFSFIFIQINLVIIIFYSLIFALIISYEFNLFLYKKIRKIEQLIDSKLNFIRIDYNLIRKASEYHSDPPLQFIKLMVDYNISISKDFKEMLFKIHCGVNPEFLLRRYYSHSREFNQYLDTLLLSNFRELNSQNNKRINSLEESFKVYLKEITTKLSIIFFIGIFFPIGLCFFLFLLPINHFVIICFIPLFFLLLNLLFDKFISKNHYLIGMSKQNSKHEATKLNQFIVLIEKFALNLKNNVSPEKAFLNAYIKERNNVGLIEPYLDNNIKQFFNGIQNFIDMLDHFKRSLNSMRYRVMIDTIVKMLKENAYLSSSKILKIIQILRNHQHLQKELLILIRGERFKTLVYLFLLPVIIGSIGALSPFLSTIVNILIRFEDPEMITFKLTLTLIVDIIIIYSTLVLTNSISSYYFLSIINFQSKVVLIIFSDIIFSLIFILFLTNFFII